MWRRTRRGRGRRGAALLALALVGFALGSAAALERHRLLGLWLRARLRGAGLADASLSVTRFDWGRVELREVRAAGGRLALALAELRFSLPGLAAGRLDDLRVEGLEAGGTPGEAGAWLASLVAALARGPGPGLAARSLELTEARLALETALGPAELRGGLRARGGEDGLEAEARAEGSSGIVRFRATLSAAGPPERLAGELALELEAKGAALGASIGGARLSLAAEVRTQDGGLEIVPRECAQLHVERLSFAERVELAAPLRACLGAPREPLLRLALVPGAPVTLAGRLSVPAAPLELALAGGRLRLSGETPELELELDGTVPAPRLRVESRRGLLESPDLELVARGLTGSLSLGPGRRGAEGRLLLEAIEDVARPERLPRLALRAELGPAGGGRSAFRATLSDDGRTLAAEASGLLGGGAPASARLRLEPVPLGPGGLELASLVPPLAGLLAGATGTIEARASLGSGGSGEPAGLELALHDLSLAGEPVQVERANGVVRLEGLVPPATPPEQLLALGRLDLGLELGDGLVSFALSPEQGFVLEEAEWSFAGGVAQAVGALDPAAGEPRLVLEVEGARLAELLARLDLPGLAGEGLLDGEIPLVLRQGSLAVEGAVLSSASRGWLRYEPASGADPSREVLASHPALAAGLPYHALELRLDGAAPGEVAVGLSLVAPGAAPGAAPLELDLALPGRLGALEPAALEGYEIPEEVAARLARFAAE
jgi:hypothetical protein